MIRINIVATRMLRTNNIRKDLTMTSIALGPTVSHTEVLERILYVHALNMIVYYLQRVGRPTIKMLHCCSFYDKYLQIKVDSILSYCVNFY